MPWLCADTDQPTYACSQVTSYISYFVAVVFLVPAVSYSFFLANMDERKLTDNKDKNVSFIDKIIAKVRPVYLQQLRIRNPYLTAVQIWIGSIAGLTMWFISVVVSLTRLVISNPAPSTFQPFQPIPIIRRSASDIGNGKRDPNNSTSPPSATTSFNNELRRLTTSPGLDTIFEDDPRANSDSSRRSSKRSSRDYERRASSEVHINPIVEIIPRRVSSDMGTIPHDFPLTASPASSPRRMASPSTSSRRSVSPRSISPRSSTSPKSLNRISRHTDISPSISPRTSHDIPRKLQDTQGKPQDTPWLQTRIPPSQNPSSLTAPTLISSFKKTFALRRPRSLEKLRTNSETLSSPTTPSPPSFRRAFSLSVGKKPKIDPPTPTPTPDVTRGRTTKPKRHSLDFGSLHRRHNLSIVLPPHPRERTGDRAGIVGLSTAEMAQPLSITGTDRESRRRAVQELVYGTGSSAGQHSTLPLVKVGR